MLAGWINREQNEVIEYLKLEREILREQLGPTRLRFTDSQRRRLAAAGRTLGRTKLRELGCIVTPDTRLRWYRQLIAQKYDGSMRRKRGRPNKSQEMADLIVRMSRENPRWGYTRIRDAMNNLGFTVGRTTVQRILRDHGIEPAPERERRGSWATFLRSHMGTIAAADFFTVELLTVVGLARHYVFFVIDIGTRSVEIAGIAHQPYGAWMLQIARNLVDVEDGFLRTASHLILDRDPLYTKDFRSLLRSAGVKPVRLPSRSPNLNAYAERFVLSIKA